MAIDNVIDITISLDAAPVSVQGFGTLLILGVNSSASDAVTYYGSLAEFLADTDHGLISTDPEYIAITAAFSQDTPSRPNQVAIGKMTAFVNQVSTFTVGAPNTAGSYVVELTCAGITATATAASGAAATDTRDALIIAINAADIPLTATTAAGATFTLTTDAGYEGEAFTYTITAPGAPDLTAVVTTAAVGVTEGFTAALAADATGWYGVTFPGATDAQVYSLAVAVEPFKKVHVGVVGGADVIDSGDTGDALSRLQDLSLKRSLVMYHGTAAQRVKLGAALAANRLAVDPDSAATIWSFVTLSGVAVDTLSTTVQNTIEGKGGCYYVTLGGVGATRTGASVGGTKFDLIITKDWLDFRLTEAYQTIFLYYSNAGSKVPYTDAGIAIFEAATLKRLQIGVTVGHLADDPAPTVTVPKRADVSSADLLARVLRFSFRAEPAGAIEGVVLLGSVAIQL